MKFIQTNLKTLLAFLAFLIISTVLVFALIVTPNKLEKQRIEEQKAEETRKVLLYTACEQDAWDSYHTTWENNCKGKNLGDNCSLPVYVAERLNESLENAINRCVSLYK